MDAMKKLGSKWNLKDNEPVHHFNKVKRLCTFRTTGQSITEDKINNDNMKLINISNSALYVFVEVSTTLLGTNDSHELHLVNYNDKWNCESIMKLCLTVPHSTSVRVKYCSTQPWGPKSTETIKRRLQEKWNELFIIYHGNPL